MAHLGPWTKKCWIPLRYHYHSSNETQPQHSTIQSVGEEKKHFAWFHKMAHMAHLGPWTEKSWTPRRYHYNSSNVTQPQLSTIQSVGEEAFGIFAKNGPSRHPSWPTCDLWHPHFVHSLMAHNPRIIVPKFEENASHIVRERAIYSNLWTDR